MMSVVIAASGIAARTSSMMRRYRSRRYERRIAFRTRSEPDCSGMCSEGITFGVSAIASITSAVKSRGCGDVNRTRSRPSIPPQARSSLENAYRSPNSTPYEFTFWPSRVTSSTPSATSASTSARTSPGRRSFSGRAARARCRTCRCCCSRR